jgi:hypothetical protein
MRVEAEKMRRYRKSLKNEKGRDDQNKDEEKVDDRAKTDGVENSIKSSSLNIQFFVRKENIAVKSQQVKQAVTVVGEKGYCSFCGSEGVIVEKFSARGYG